MIQWKFLAKTSSLFTSKHDGLQTIFVLIPQNILINILFPTYDLKRDFARKLLKFFKLMSFEYWMTVGQNLRTIL